MRSQEVTNRCTRLSHTSICTATTVGAVSAPQASTSSADTACRADTVLYNGCAPLLLAIDGQTAYYIAPVDAASGINWDDDTLARAICIDNDNVSAIIDCLKTSKIHVRCVRRKIR